MIQNSNSELYRGDERKNINRLLIDFNLMKLKKLYELVVIKMRCVYVTASRLVYPGTVLTERSGVLRLLRDCFAIAALFC